MKNGKVYLGVLVCYLIWGMQPLYWSWLGNFAPLFTLCVRVFMSVVTSLLFLARAGRLGDYIATLRDWSQMKHYLPSSFVLAVDWALFIWAVTSEHVIDASIGYYLAPLVIFLAGLVIFRERGHALEFGAVGLACVGVAICLVGFGTFPMLALILAIIWPTYAILKRAIRGDGLVSFAVETTLMLPYTLAYALLFCRGEGGFASLTWGAAPLLLLSGVVTALPIVLYIRAVNVLPLTLMGILQYAGTSITLVCGTLFMHEPLTLPKLVMLLFIWAGLILLTLGNMRKRKSTAAPAAEPVAATIPRSPTPPGSSPR